MGSNSVNYSLPNFNYTHKFSPNSRNSIDSHITIWGFNYWTGKHFLIEFCFDFDFLGSIYVFSTYLYVISHFLKNAWWWFFIVSLNFIYWQASEQLLCLYRYSCFPEILILVNLYLIEFSLCIVLWMMETDCDVNFGRNWSPT